MVNKLPSGNETNKPNKQANGANTPFAVADSTATADRPDNTSKYQDTIKNYLQISYRWLRFTAFPPTYRWFIKPVVLNAGVWTALATVFIAIWTGVYTHYAKRQWQAIEGQNRLLRQQLVGTLAAVVSFTPSISGHKLNPVLENRGSVISPYAHISFRWGISTLSKPDAFLRQGNYSNTIPQLPPGGHGELLDIGITPGENFAGQEYTVKIEGSFDFDNGFGDRPPAQTFCYYYLGKAQVLSEQGTIETDSAGFTPCSDFPERLAYFQTHRIQTKEQTSRQSQPN
ncbi:MAG TPA: hypothetical protein VGR72_05245 [Candidatus Acidoferrales bacterium]|nr:hypothetical protein [Candidatus Acidoferrales bacterium]